MQQDPKRTTTPESRQANWAEALEIEALRSPVAIESNSVPQADGISVASVWQMESPESANAALGGQNSEFIYRRDGHPNERTLASRLAKLHGGHSAIITAQGMSSIGAIALAILKPGDQAWIANELYGKSVHLFSKELARWQIKVITFDPTRDDDVERLAAADAKLVLIETISNPRLRLPDLSKLSKATRERGGTLVVDNTFATHLLCRPLDFGANLVVESLGKQVNGHSDAMAGLIVGDDAEQMKLIQNTVSTFGMASSPLDCFLTQRGLSSLSVRVERACRNALHLAERLSALDAVEVVDYPGLPTHPQHELANRQLSGGFGWMVTFRLKPATNGTQKLMNALKPEFPFVPSLGDVCTTVSHPFSTSHRSLPKEEQLNLGITEGTIRVSCGIEPTEWLSERFCAAIDQI